MDDAAEERQDILYIYDPKLAKEDKAWLDTQKMFQPNDLKTAPKLKPEEIKAIEDGAALTTNRLTIMGGFMFLVTCQFALIYYLLLEVLYDENITFQCFPDKIGVVMTRFICGTVLHFNL